MGGKGLKFTTFFCPSDILATLDLNIQAETVPDGAVITILHVLE